MSPLSSSQPTAKMSTHMSPHGPDPRPGSASRTHTPTYPQPKPDRQTNPPPTNTQANNLLAHSRDVVGVAWGEAPRLIVGLCVIVAHGHIGRHKLAAVRLQAGRQVRPGGSQAERIQSNKTKVSRLISDFPQCPAAHPPRALLACCAIWSTTPSHWQAASQCCATNTLNTPSHHMGYGVQGIAGVGFFGRSFDRHCFALFTQEACSRCRWQRHRS